ncbi:MAG: DNRLRE domain-containing protein [Theionarchaea archaeon]|nr:DNRLRE domain-containing protein [Theionarchaea archaeon]
MKSWIFLMVLAMSLSILGSITSIDGSEMLYSPGQNSLPASFFITPQRTQKCLIVVGETADARDIVEASHLASALGHLLTRDQKIPIIEKVSVTHENIPPATCIVETPLTLPTLWYFDDFGVYGNDNDRFDPWETHEEIQVYIDDLPERDPLMGWIGNGYLDFSTILRIDNVRVPPYITVTSLQEEPRGEQVVDLHHMIEWHYFLVDPYFVYFEYLPQIELFDSLYTVLYIDSSLLITGIPHLEYVYLSRGEVFTAGSYTISVLDVDKDHNKVYLRVVGPGVQEEFWMVLDPEHGFSPSLQKSGTGNFLSFDFDHDGTPEYFNKWVVGRSELDVWGNSIIVTRGTVHFGFADIIIDGIKTFIGESVGAYLGIYWVEEMHIWPEMTCCDPFVKYPQPYYLQIRPDTVTVRASGDTYVDQLLPAQNFGTSPALSVKSFLNANKRAYITFNLPILPQKAIITKAILQLSPLTIPSRTYEVSRVTAPWNEATLTWSTQPGAVLTGTQLNASMEWDVTSDVQAFYGGTPNYGWRISDQAEDSPILFEIQYGSRESPLNPRLTITYTFDCNYLSEIIPHIPNFIGTFYDDITDDGIKDPVYEIDIGICEVIKTLCDPLFFEGPNYYFFIDFQDTSFADGVDFTLYQTQRMGTYSVEIPTTPSWELIKLDTEISEEDRQYNWILIGGNTVNVWVDLLVTKHMVPDDGSPVTWFLTSPGYKLYSDPFAYGNRVCVVAGKTAEDTRTAIQIFIDYVLTLT